ncbi:MAG: MOSC N-terminal beta barrel domain-containing protein [Actinomycetota bacterium]|nr:MOSC N-terminal beta barrel domain-containing protein [Actinomycetota bacterium]
MALDGGTVVGRVAEVWRFPVKSMLGERLDQVQVSTAGVVGDRSWALVDAEDGKVVSAKNPRKWSRILELRASFLEEPGADGPAAPVRIELPDGTVAASPDPGASDTISAFLGRDVRLRSVPPAVRTMEETWPDVEGLAPEAFIERTRIDTGVPDETVSDIAMAMAAPPGTFFDLSVLHLITSSTLQELARLQPDGAFDVRRYRPNVLVESEGVGFVENGWVGRRLGLGPAAEMQVALPTMRCIMTTLAIEDLPRDPSLLRTIATHNRLEIGGLGTWACAGVYGDAAEPGSVAVGDEVRVGDATAGPDGGRPDQT